MTNDTGFTCGVLTLSDKGARGERADTSGTYLRDCLTAAGFTVQQYLVIEDDRSKIVQTLRRFVDLEDIDLIVTTGGTGLSPRDVTPEAMDDVVEREVPGIAEAMRAASMMKTDRAMLSRGRAGIRGQSLIINLPGSLKAVRENIAVVLPVLLHALAKIKGDPSDCAAG